MDWAKGYTAHFEVIRKNDDWTDGETVGRVRSISIERDCTDDASLLESAAVSVDVDSLGDVYEGWVRIDMVAEQRGLHERVPLGCFLLAASDAVASAGAYEVSFDGSSVLSTADSAIVSGSYAPKGSDAAQWAAEQLSGLVPSSVSVSGSAILPNHVVFGDSDSVLSAVWAVLDAVGFVMRTIGDGSVVVCPAPSEPSAYMTMDSPHGLQPGVKLGERISYTREFDPDISVFDRVVYGVPAYGLDGVRTVVSQSLEAGAGLLVTEETEDAEWAR